MKERSSEISLLLHFSSFLVNCVGVYYDVYHTYMPQYSRFAGRARFLTRHVEYFSLFFTGFAVLSDLHFRFFVGKNEKPVMLQWRDFLFATLQFPFSVLVVLLFWGICSVDVNGMVPPEIRERYPLLGGFNFFLHVWPMVFSVVCSVLVFHKYPSRKRGLFITVGYGILYLAWLMFLGWYDVWPYGFLSKLSVAAFIVFMVSATTAGTLFYVSGEWLTKVSWGHLKFKEG